jgi:hypothetical protein
VGVAYCAGGSGGGENEYWPGVAYVVGGGFGGGVDHWFDDWGGVGGGPLPAPRLRAEKDDCRLEAPGLVGKAGGLAGRDGTTEGTFDPPSLCCTSSWPTSEFRSEFRALTNAFALRDSELERSVSSV